MRFLALIFAAFTLAILAFPVAAAPPSGSVVLDQTAPSYGDTITFTVDPPVWLGVTCYQGGGEYNAVYGQYWNYEPGYWPTDADGNPLDPSQDTTVAYNGQFTLSSSLWTGGAAECTATLFSVTGKHHKETVLDTLAFSVGA